MQGRAAGHNTASCGQSESRAPYICMGCINWFIRSVFSHSTIVCVPLCFVSFKVYHCGAASAATYRRAPRFVALKNGIISVLISPFTALPRTAPSARYKCTHTHTHTLWHTPAVSVNACRHSRQESFMHTSGATISCCMRKPGPHWHVTARQPGDQQKASAQLVS